MQIIFVATFGEFDPMSPPSPYPNMLYLTHYKGNAFLEIKPAMSTKDRLVWDVSARVCNKMTTKVTLFPGQSKMSSSAVYSTKLHCPGENGKLEAKLKTLLSTLTRMSLDQEGESSDFNSRKNSKND